MKHILRQALLITLYATGVLGIMLWSKALANEEPPPALFGVRLETNVPLSGDLTNLVRNPAKYALNNPDTLSASAFIERGRTGVELLWRSSNEFRLGAYYTMSAGTLFGITQETRIGLQTTYRNTEWSINAQAVITLYGTLP